ncbi:MAG TPA: sigma-70 family RNA polymerase sigma factor [Steroidobacteraceae bacterium]|jgi:RNA polymerase sigma-70 factor (ECF subfamily)|nr:sigma-70 family RNA polymerase sigma factor [Steroidobacteraceae bacterium]
MDASATSDETLLLRYATGDVAAFEELYARHELPLWRYVLRTSGNRATAEELLQDTWFAVAREASRFKPGAHFAAWLYTIARNRVIDRHRTTRRHASLDETAAETGLSLAERLADAAAPQPAQQAEQAQQGKAILAALALLPPEQREAFVLQAESGMSVEEIAAVTGTTFETAKSRLRYAREKLKALLGDHA